MDKIIAGNILIREFTIDDVSAYYKNNKEEQIKKYMPNHWHNDETEARKEITGFLADYKPLKMPCHFALTKGNILIGHIGIGETELSGNNNIHEICCAVSKAYRGFGYAAEAAKAFVPWCKYTFGLDKIYASADSENASSCKSLINAGFTLTDIKINDNGTDVYVHG